MVSKYEHIKLLTAKVLQYTLLISCVYVFFVQQKKRFTQGECSSPPRNHVAISHRNNDSATVNTLKVFMNTKLFDSSTLLELICIYVVYI